MINPNKKHRKNNLIDRGQKSNPSFSFWMYFILFVFFIGYYFFSNKSTAPKEINWKKFQNEMLLSHDVEKVNVVNKETVQVYIKKKSLQKERYKSVAKNFFKQINTGPHYFFLIGSVDVFEKQLDEAQIKFSEQEKITVQYTNTENKWLTVLLSWVIPIVLLWAFWYFIFRRYTSGQGGKGRSIFDFGKSNPEVFEKETKSKITFKDVAGYDEAKTEVMEIVDFLKHPNKFIKLGAKIPKGILLVGAPGTGKTLMAKAVAGEAGVPFFSLSGSEFIEMFVGVGASRVRDLFQRAKEKAPSIVFIDEIDTIGRVRGKVLSMQVNDERDSTLNQLLSEMDGFDPNTGIIVLAATNRADILDPALLRPGRFDRHIHLDFPNKKERLDIFKVHLKPLLLDKSINIDYLATQTPGFSGADIANVCNEAALIAVRKNKKMIDDKDFFDAIDRVITGIEKKSRIISPQEKKVIAYHEAGHAITSWMLKNVDPLLKVSIIPHGQSLGGTWYLPEERQIISRAQFFDNLCAALGGRTAEEVVFNEISSGSLDDLEKVTKQAYIMVAQLGLSKKIGNISFHDSTGMYENSLQKPYSEHTAQLIDEEVRKLVEDAHKTTRIILESNRDKLDTLANLLIQKEVVYKDEIESVLGKRISEEKEVKALF